MSGQMSPLNGLICVIMDIGLRAAVTPATHQASVTPIITQTMSTQSTDLGRSGLMLESTGQTELDIALMSLVLLGEIVTHIVKLSPSGTLTQVNTLRLRCSGIVAPGAILALMTLSLREVIVVPPLIRKGRRSQIRRGSTLPLLVLLIAALPLLPLEKEKESDTSLKRRRRNTLNHVRPNVTNVRRSTRGRGVLLHLLLLCLLQFLQTLLLLLREAQPGRGLELILGHLLRLMTILIPLLGLRIQRHTRIILVYIVGSVTKPRN